MLQTSEEKARFIIDNISARPKMSIPWDIYDDPDKRIAYSKTEEYRSRMEPIGKWLKSDEAVRNAAYVKLLHSFGFTAVEQIIPVLEQESISKDKRDYLAQLAAEILRKQSPDAATLPGGLASLVTVLGDYVEGMEDAGAGSRRAHAATNLNVFFGNIGLSRQIPVNTNE